MANGGISPAKIDQGIIAILRSEDKGFQLALVESDGQLSWTEYDGLFSALQQCVADRGGELSNTRLGPGNTYDFSVLTGPGDAGSSCIAEFWEPLGAYWSLSHPPPTDVLLAANRMLADCLRAGGVSIELAADEQPRADDFRRLGGFDLWLGEPFMSCVDTVSETFLLPGFRGY